MLRREVLSPQMPRAWFVASLVCVGTLGAFGVAAGIARMVEVPQREAVEVPQHEAITSAISSDGTFYGQSGFVYTIGHWSNDNSFNLTFADGSSDVRELVRITDDRRLIFAGHR